MQALVSTLQPAFLIECTDQECLDLANSGEASKKDVIEVEESDPGEVTSLPSLILGVIIILEAFLPLLMWSLLRSTDIEAAFDLNPWYTRAWKWMYMSHYFVFGLAALLWPFTFLGSQVVNDFFMLENFFVTTILGFIFVTINLILFLMAWAGYKATDKVD